MHRAVVVGCGNMARRWIEALRGPDLAGRAEIVGLVDIDERAAERLRAEAGVAGAVIGSDLASLLERYRPDMVFDIVVPDARHDVVTTALSHGCHVLSEKPMATSLDQAEVLLALAQRSGRLHVVMQNRRYVPGVRRIRRLVETGALGDLTALHADFFVGAHFGGFREAMQHPLLLDMAIHTFDAARFMAGGDARAVYCSETNPRQSWFAHGGAANAIFEFEDNVVFTYRGSWVAEGASTSWEGSWRIIGTAGTLTWNGGDVFEARVVNGEDGFLRPLRPIEVPPPPDSALVDGHASVIGQFLNAVEGGPRPETVGADNIQSLAMVFTAIESARRGTRVPLAGRRFP